MLQKLRDKTTGWIATVILGLLIVPFAFFGIEQYMVQRTDNYVAKIDAPPTWWQTAPAWWPVSVFWRHDEIAIDDFRAAYERARQQARTEQGAAFDGRAFESADNKRAILDSLIDQRVQRMSAQQSGVVVSESQVRDTIQGITAFQVDGKFNPDRYRLALASQVPAQTPRDFERVVREGLQQSMYASGIAESGFVTGSELDRLIRLMGEKRDARVLVVPAPAADTGPVTAAEIQQWYQTHQSRYRMPESVSIEYVELDAKSMPPPPAADEASLRQRYEQEKSRYTQQEQRLASHILVRVEEGANAAAQKAAEQKAAQLAAQAQAAGADFAALARSSSDDTGSKATGGDLGWVSKGSMVPAFEKALFAMKAGQVSAPVKSEYGWHVIQLREVKGGAQETFEEAREALAIEQAEADRERAFNELSTRLVDLVLKNPSSLGPAARAVNLPVQKAGPFARNAAEGIAAQPAVQRAAFSDRLIQDGMVSDPIEIAPGHSVLIRVVSHTPERVQPLAQVRDQVIAAVRGDRSAKLAAKQADALLVRVKAGETLEAIAAAQGLPAPQVVGGLPRGAPVVDPAVSDALFAVAPPAAGKPSTGKVVLPDGRIVPFAVSGVTPGSPAEVSPEHRALPQQQLAQIAGGSDTRQLVRALRQRMKVKVVESNL